MIVYELTKLIDPRGKKLSGRTERYPVEVSNPGGYLLATVPVRTRESLGRAAMIRNRHPGKGGFLRQGYKTYFLLSSPCWYLHSFRFF
jgi:hypothetical protein